MTGRRLPILLALTSVALVAALAAWGLASEPERGRWLIVAIFLPLLWGFLELAQTRGPDEAVGLSIMTFHRSVIAWTGLMIVVRVGSRLAVSAGLVDAALIAATRRVTGLLLGIGLILFGNYLPKLLSPWARAEEPFDWQRVHRFAGWAFLLAGAGVTIAWAAAPEPSARRATIVMLGTAMVLGIGRKAMSVATRWRQTVR